MSISATFNIVDPSHVLTTNTSALLIADAQAAMNQWSPWIAGRSPLTVQINLTPTSNGLAADEANVVNVGFLGQTDPNQPQPAGSISLLETQADAKLSGTPIRSTPLPYDIVVDFTPNFLLTNYLDPNPTVRNSTFTAGDVISILTHEFGHAFAFISGLDSYGQSDGTFETKFDTFISRANTQPGTPAFFVGPHAMAVYGGPVPLSVAPGDYSYGHLGPTNGSNPLLVMDVMNGFAMYTGARYFVSVLDLAFAQDMGLTITGGYSNLPMVHTSLADGSGYYVAQAGAKTIIATETNAQIFGNYGNQVLVGGVGKNIITGGAGNDTLVGGLGKATLDGGDGINTAVFMDPLANYTLSNVNSVITVTEKNGHQAAETLTHIQLLQFADQTVPTGTPVISVAADSLELALIDPAFYLSHNQDVLTAGVNPIAHFLSNGEKEGRNPDAFFDVNYYLSHNPDIQAAGVDPLLHYAEFGWREGRDPSAAFSTKAYLTANQDVKLAGINPLVHYLEFGLSEGRSIGA